MVGLRGGGQGGCELRSEAFVKIQKKKNFFLWRGGGVGLGGGGVRFGWGGGGQGGCEWRSKAFVKIKKKYIFVFGGGGGGVGGRVNGGGSGWGGGVRVDVNGEVKLL